MKITDKISVGGTRKRRLNSNSESRVLQTDGPAVVVTYTQNLWYSSDDPGFDPNYSELPLVPLSELDFRDEYVGTLKSESIQGYEDLTSVSAISLESDSTSVSAEAPSGDESNTGMSLGAIIGIVIGVAVGLFIAVAGFLNSRKKNDKVDDNGRGVEGQPLPTQLEFATGQEPTTKTVSTMDYDYGNAFGGVASEAGGTLGSQTRQTAADAGFEDMVMGTVATSPGGLSADPTVFTGQDPTGDLSTFDQEHLIDTHEELIDVYAPAGKLGMVVDTPGEGAPVIHAVKDTSPLAGKVIPGDKLVAIDDEDVRTMTAIRVSKLLSRKSNNEFRKLTVVRLVKND